MANTIKPKRSQTPGATPTLAAGEMAVNIADKKIWVANSAGAPVLIVDGNASGSGNETDPVFTASDAFGITAADIAKWNAKPDTVAVTSSGGTITITNNSASAAVSYNIETPQGISSSDAPAFAGLSIAGMTYPGADGSAGQALVTDGLGNLGWTTITPGAISLDDLSDVTLNVPLAGQVLLYDSVLGQWQNGALTTTGVSEGSNLYHTTARARAALSAGTGISFNSSTGVITNSSPAQTVTLIEGSGITITGAHPTFTIAASGGGGSATNISGGSAGNLVYQSAASTTAFLSNPGNNYYVLQGTAGVPQWVENLSFFSGGRLTLDPNYPDNTHVPSSTTIYYTPYNGDKISVWDGDKWRPFKIQLPGMSKSLGTLTAGRNYDVFVWLSGSYPTLEFLPWLNDTQRANELVTSTAYPGAYFYWVYQSVVARYLGTFRTTSTTTTADTASKRFVWSHHNQGQKVLWAGGGSSHTYTTAAWRNWNNDAAARAEWVTGLKRPQTLHFGSAATGTSTDAGAAFDGANPGYDSVNGTGTGVSQIRAGRSYTIEGNGYHYCQIKEYGAAGATFYDARLEGSIWC